MSREYFENYNEMFLTEGWKQLLEELKFNLEELNSVENVSSNDNLWQRKGQIATIAYICNLEAQMELLSKEDANEEDL